MNVANRSWLSSSDAGVHRRPSIVGDFNPTSTPCARPAARKRAASTDPPRGGGVRCFGRGQPTATAVCGFCGPGNLHLINGLYEQPHGRLSWPLPRAHPERGPDRLHLLRKRA